MHVFISHSRLNSSIAFLLCEELHKRNVDTWLDLRDLQPGAEWEPSVKTAIESASGIVFLIGPPGPTDRWQTFEWQQVVGHEYYLDPSKPLIPVLIGGGSPDMPGFLKTRQSLTLGDTLAAVQDAADQIVKALHDPSTSVDHKEIELVPNCISSRI
jgi:hypothetical protein